MEQEQNTMRDSAVNDLGWSTSGYRGVYELPLAVEVGIFFSSQPIGVLNGWLVGIRDG